MKKFYLKFISLIVATGFISLPAYSADHTVEFLLTYPVVKTADGVKYRGRIYSGLTLSYQYSLSNNFGLVLGPSVWGVPLEMQGQRRVLAVVTFLTGVVFMPFPTSYFDPRFMVWGGAGMTDAGSAVPARSIFPVMGDASIVIYRVQSPFQDQTLGLTLLAGYARYFNQNKSLVDRDNLEFGIGMRGSF